MRAVERSRDRMELVQEAGLRTTSWVSVVAGTMVAFGALTLLLGTAAAVADALGLDTDGLSTDDWQNVGFGAAAAFAVVSFLAYFFGGYVAGRMARRAGLRHGLLALALGLLLSLGVAGVANLMGDRDAAVDDLRDQGVPTEADDWEGVGLVAGIATLAAMVLGAALGGKRGESWHGRLVTRAADPSVLSRDAARVQTEEEQERVRAAERREHLGLEDREEPVVDHDRDRAVERERVTVPDRAAEDRPAGSRDATGGWRRLFHR